MEMMQDVLWNLRKRLTVWKEFLILMHLSIPPTKKWRNGRNVCGVNLGWIQSK